MRGLGVSRDGEFPPEIIDALVRKRENYRRAVACHLDGHEDAELRQVALVSLEARRMEIQAERDRLTEMLRQGEIDDEVLVQVQHDLDLREARLQEYRQPGADKDRRGEP